MKKLSSQTKDFLIFVSPTLILSVIIMFYPLFTSLGWSFCSYYLSSTPKFVGVRNFISLLKDDIFWITVKNTGIIVGLGVPFQFLISVGLALLLSKITKGANFFRTAMFLPMAMTPVVTGLIIRWLLLPRWGWVNYYLGLVGIKGPVWIGDPFYGLLAIIFADSWKEIPFVTMVLFAGIQSLPTQPIEAARIDGASRLQVLTHIILPLLTPLILFVIVIRVIDAFRIFDYVYAITGGGPGVSTETLMFYNYKMAFELLKLGKASALAVLSLLLIAAGIATFIYLLNKREKGEW